MRKIYLVLFLFGLHIGYLSAQENNDQAAVLQLCVDLPELQEFYRVDQLYFMSHGVDFGNEIKLSHNGVRVEFYDKQGIKTLGVPDFFLIWQFNVQDNSAKIIGQYVLNFESESSVPFELTLEKQEGLWDIVEYEIN